MIQDPAKIRQQHNTQHNLPTTAYKPSNHQPSTQTLHMDTLPEELLEQIIANVTSSHIPFFTPPDAATLNALCRTSSKTYRIARPYLYTHVHSHSGPMGRQFLNTIIAQPELADRVKHFAVQHTAEGCFQPVESSIEQLDVYGTVTDTCAALLLETLPVLAQLEALDLSRFTRKDSSLGWLKSMAEMIDEQPSSLRKPPQLFSSLRHLSVHLGPMAVYELLPFLRLPHLRSLEVDVRRVNYAIQPQTLDTDYICSITSLSVIGYTSIRRSELSWLAARCPALESLLVTTNTYIDAGNSQDIGNVFAEHTQNGSLKSFRIAMEGRYWVMMTINVREGGAKLGYELFHALHYAADNLHNKLGGEVEIPPDKWKSVWSIAKRKLTTVEKRAYDPKLLRRP
jgi:hypothetical protein